MPQQLKRFCSHTGCPVLVLRGRCPEHERQKNKAYREKIGNAPYNDRKWRAASAAYRKEHPLCVICKRKGQLRSSEHVDHIIPLRDGGAMWDQSNWQALCASCHSSKTMTEIHDKSKKNEERLKN